MIAETIAIRHFNDIEDHTLSGRDFDIDLSEEKYVVPIVNHIQSELSRLEAQSVRVISSPRLRARKTAQLVTDCFSARTNLATEVDIDERLRELNHGSYNLPAEYTPGEPFLPDQEGWKIWIEQTFVHKNLAYRFGDPLRVGQTVQYPSLEGHFLEFGESQAQFSYRMYDFMIDLAKSVDEDGSATIIFSHLANILRIHEITQVLRDIDGQFPSNIYLGTLPFLEWNALQSLPKDLINKVSKPIYSTTIDLDLVKKYIPLLEVERDLMQAIITQQHE